MTPASLAWQVEETCRNAWPALRQVLLDGWVLRFSDGLTRRANSANPLPADFNRADALIPACEALYRRQLLPTIFRVPSIIDPDLEWTFRKQDSFSLSRNTPFDGWELKGRAVRTIVAGKTIWKA